MQVAVRQQHYALHMDCPQQLPLLYMVLHVGVVGYVNWLFAAIHVDGALGVRADNASPPFPRK